MFSTIYSVMRSNDESIYIERLDSLFKDFIDLRYVVDEAHEKYILTSLIFNLTAIALCRKSMYISTIWNQAYNAKPFDLCPQDGLTFRDYADQIALTCCAFEDSKTGELELIRMLICYTKCKNYDLPTMLMTFIDKY